MLHLHTDTPAAAAELRINREPASKPVINLGEARLVKASFQAAHRPGLCARTILAGIVAAGSLQGLDLSQEADALAPLLEAQAARPLMRLA